MGLRWPAGLGPGCGVWPRLGKNRPTSLFRTSDSSDPPPVVHEPRQLLSCLSPPPVRIRPSVVGWLRRARPCVQVPVSSVAWIRCVPVLSNWLLCSLRLARTLEGSPASPLRSCWSARTDEVGPAARRTVEGRQRSMGGGSQWQEVVNRRGRSTDKGSPRKGGKGGSPQK